MLRKLEQYEREFDERDRQREELRESQEEEGDEEDFGFDFEHAYEEDEDLLKADDELFRTLSASASPPLSAGAQHRPSHSHARPRSQSRSPPRSASPGMRKHHTEPLLVLRGREREKERNSDRESGRRGVADDEMSDRARARLTELERAREREKEEDFVRSLSPSQRRLRLASEDALLEKLVHSGKLSTNSFLPPLRVGSSQSAQRQSFFYETRQDHTASGSVNKQTNLPFVVLTACITHTHTHTHHSRGVLMEYSWGIHAYECLRRGQRREKSE